MLRIQDDFESSGQSYMPTESKVSAALKPPKVLTVVDTVSGRASQANQLIDKAKGGPDFLVDKLKPVVNLLDELSKVRSTSFSLFFEQCP